jgi:hypothetical protein
LKRKCFHDGGAILEKEIREQETAAPSAVQHDRFASSLRRGSIDL